jgi:hypothetical protein
MEFIAAQLKLTIYHTQGKHPNNYTTDAVSKTRMKVNIWFSGRRL